MNMIIFYRFYWSKIITIGIGFYNNNIIRGCPVFQLCVPLFWRKLCVTHFVLFFPKYIPCESRCILSWLYMTSETYSMSLFNKISTFQWYFSIIVLTILTSILYYTWYIIKLIMLFFQQNDHLRLIITSLSAM